MLEQASLLFRTQGKWTNIWLLSHLLLLDFLFCTSNFYCRQNFNKSMTIVFPTPHCRMQYNVLNFPQFHQRFYISAQSLFCSLCTLNNLPSKTRFQLIPSAESQSDGNLKIFSSGWDKSTGKCNGSHTSTEAWNTLMDWFLLKRTQAIKATWVNTESNIYMNKSNFSCSQ